MILSKQTKKNEPKMSNGELTAQEFVNVKNVEGRFLFDKRDMVYMYIEITPIVTDLLTEAEQMMVADSIKEYLKEEREPFILFKLQKGVDVSRISNSLFDLKQSISAKDIAEQRRKELISIEIEYLDKAATDNTTVSPVYCLKIWDTQKNMDKLSVRAKHLASKYSMVGMPAHVLEQREILTICSLFTNPTTAQLHDNTYRDMYSTSIVPKI